MDSEDEELIPTRETLLSRLKDWNDQSSWNRFFQTYWKLIYRTALHAGLTQEEAQEVVQETVLSVCRRMPEFRYDPGRGSFKAWLLKVTQWRIRDQWRKRMPVNRAMGVPDEGRVQAEDIEEIPDPGPNELEGLWDQEWNQNLLNAALERIKLRVDPKQYQVFDQYAVKNVPLAQVCRLFQVSAGRVYLIKHRMTRLLQREMRKLEAIRV
jgi:RNA polymerase sigma factor (sigma-70 family)